MRLIMVSSVQASFSSVVLMYFLNAVFFAIYCYIVNFCNNLLMPICISS